MFGTSPFILYISTSNETSSFSFKSIRLLMLKMGVFDVKGCPNERGNNIVK